MTLAVTHTLVAVTPDDPAYEIRPSHWNDSHAITGTASVAQGGTGATSFTAGEILFGNGTSAIDHSSGLTWNATTGLLSLKPISCPGPVAKDETFGAIAKIWADGGENTAIGYNARVGTSSSATGAGGLQNTVVGANASIGNFGYTGIAIGANASGGNTVSAVVIGAGNTSTASYSTIVGANSSATAANCSGVFGANSIQSHTGGLLIGQGISSARTYELAYGWTFNTVNPVSFRLSGSTGSFVERDMLRWGGTWIDSTDATRKARSSFYVYDTAEREFMRSDALGASVQSQMSGAFYPPDDAGAIQAASAIRAGTGVPNNANGADGDYYFRSDGGVATHIYFKAAGSWAGII